MKIHNFEQKSDEWYSARAMKMTASKADAIGTAGAGLKTLITQMCCDFVAINEREKYTNEAMERGNELEKSIRYSYEFETGNTVKEIGFVEHDNFVGCSPDGFCNNDGLVEIKSHNRDVFFKLLLDNKIASKYIWQMQMQMLVCKKKWCDYVAGCEDFTQKLHIIRIYPDEKKQAKLLEGFIKGKELMRDILTEYNEKFHDEKVSEVLNNLHFDLIKS